MTVKTNSALKWTAWIFGITIAFELLVMLLGGLSPKLLVRMLILGVLFALLLKGYRFPRYVLGLLYLGGGLFALFTVLSNPFSPVLAVLLLPFGGFCLVAAWFFFRSRALRAWTGARTGQALTDGA